MKPQNSESVSGILYGASAYILWGVTVIYWKFLSHVSAIEIVSHRVIWAAILLALILIYKRRFMLAIGLLKDRKRRWVLIGCGSFLAVNWSIFVWAIVSDRILEASLGYYINPLISVLIGFVFLAEKMNKIQVASVTLAALGVTGMLVINGSLPWPSLALAITFAIYGYLRKTGGFAALDALFVEVILFVPVGLGLLFWLEIGGQPHIASFSLATWLLLAGGGLVTFLPLWCFGEGVVRTRLTTMGLLQFIAPTVQFFLAVLIYGEPFTKGHIFAFTCIWAAVTVYIADIFLRDRQLKASRQLP